jgi:hypothetical protein
MDLAHSNKERRFEILTPLECLGKQEMLTDIRKHTSELRAKTSKDSSDFLRFFFVYNPAVATKTQKNALKSKLKKTLKKSVATELVTDHS